MTAALKSLCGILVVAVLAWGVAHVSASSGAAEHSSISSRKPGVVCVKDRSGHECGRQVSIEREFAISPDGKSAYLANPFANPFIADTERSSIWIYDRNPAAGSLVQKQGTAGCIAEGRRKDCAPGRALRHGYSVVISPDARNVYVSTERSIAIFDRDSATGELTQPAGAAGCITSDLEKNPTCAPGRSLGAGIAISPDGLNIYVGGGSIAVLDRDPATGALTQKPGSEGVAADGGGVIVSPDGKNVYAETVKLDGIQTFDRNPATGALTRVPGRAGCVSEKGRRGCRRAHEFIGFGLSISPDGRNLYGAMSGGPGQPDKGALMILDRLPDGTLAQKPDRAGCFAMYGHGEGCARAESLGEARETTVSADGKRVYVFNYYDRDAAIFFRHPSGRLTEGPEG